MPRRQLRFGRYDFAAFAAFTAYAVCSFSLPLTLVAIGDSLGFPLDRGGMGAGGVLHLARSLAIIVTLLGCGLLAARFGKRIIMGSSMLVIGAGIVLAAFAPHYRVLLPALMLAGLGEGVCEGIATPFVQDLHPEAPERYVNLAHSFWSVGIAFAVVAVGGLLSLGCGWRPVLGVLGAGTLAVSLIFLWRETPGREYPETGAPERRGAAGRLLRGEFGKILREPRFWAASAAMFFGAGAEFGLTFWSAAYLELQFRTGAWTAGLGTGAIALGMFLGRTGFGYIARPGNLKYILLGTGLGTIPVTVLLAVLRRGTMADPLFFALLFLLLVLAGIGIAPFWPTTQVYGVTKMPHRDSTLLYICFSALGIPGCGFFAWLMGAAGDRFGLSGAIAVVPCCLVFFSAATILNAWILEKRAPADTRPGD